ncbi:MAG TPA: hypothetical protein VMF69_08190 [Gemmataceae bacterium]|nr:hypothetical protein [Gemmataceae bacterium]
MRVISSLIFCLLVAVPAQAGYEWRTFPDEADQLSLWHDGRQLGNWRLSTREYLPLLASGVWGDPCPPPYPPPQDVVAPGKVETDGTINFGLERSRLSAAGKHLLNGKEVSKDELLQALGSATLPDDSQWPSLTIIGPEAMRQKVISDLQSSPFLTPWKDRLKVQDYAPDHWAVKEAGFITTGQPTIYCQAPDGTVLHRQEEYRGPEALAEVLRQVDPQYKPEKDPDLNKGLAGIPLPLLIGGAVVLYLLLGKDEKR